jgi:hypothetical protein
VLKPSSVTLNSYGPTGRFGRTYDPPESVTTLRESPVSVCVIVTVAPGSTAPVSSLTTPDTCEPETACAMAVPAMTTESTAALMKSCNALTLLTSAIVTTEAASDGYGCSHPFTGGRNYHPVNRSDRL